LFLSYFSICVSRNSRAQIKDPKQRMQLVFDLEKRLQSFPREEFTLKALNKLGGRVYDVVERYLGADLDILRSLDAAVARDLARPQDLVRGQTTFETYLARFEEPILRSRPEHKGKTREHLDWNELSLTVDKVAAELGVQRYRR
jgi:hypothetical protein